MSPDERQKHRMAEMKPIMDAYWDFLSSFSSEKDSNLQKAQTYSLHQRKPVQAGSRDAESLQAAARVRDCYGHVRRWKVYRTASHG